MIRARKEITGRLDELHGGKNTLINLFIMYGDIAKTKGERMVGGGWKLNNDGTFEFSIGVKKNVRES